MAENKEKRENSRIISSDDPDALEKLRKKLEDLQAHQEYMKRANAYYKKHRTMRGFEDMPDNDAAKMDSYILSAYFDQKPYPSYILQNNNVMNAEENRIQVLFDEKPDEEIRKELKSNGFKWAPSISVWQRQLNENGVRALRRIARLQPAEQENENGNGY